MSQAPAHETTTFAQVTTSGASLPVPRTVELPFWKALSILSGAVLVSIVGTAFAVGRVLNNDHFLLVRTADDLAIVKATKVDKEVYEIHQGHILDELTEIKDILRENQKSSGTPRPPIASTPVPQSTPIPQSTPQPVIMEQTIITPTAEPSASKAPEVPKPTPEPNGPPETPPGLLKPILELL